MLRCRPAHITIDAQLDFWADRLAHQSHRVDIVCVLVSDLNLNRAVPGTDALKGVVGHVFRLAEWDRVAERDALAHLAAEQAVDRRMERLTQNVPKRHLEPGLRFFDAIKSAVELLQQEGNAEGILPNEGRSKRRLEIVLEEAAAPLEDARHLANPGDPVPRFDKDNRVIRCGGPTERSVVYTSVGSSTGSPNG